MSAVMNVSAFGLNCGPRLSVQTRCFSGSTMRMQPGFSGKACASGDCITTLFTHPDTTLLARDHDLAGLKNTEVLHEAGQRHLMTLRQTPNTGWATSELRDNRTAGAIR